MRKDNDLIIERIQQLLAAFLTPKDAAMQIPAVEALRELDQIARDYKRELPAQFIHYLERRSYQKAWAWLQGSQEIEGHSHEHQGGMV